MDKYTVRLHLGYTRGMGSVTTIRIEDDTSGEAIIEVELNDKQFRDMLASISVTIPAELPPVDVRAHYGMRMENESVQVPDHVVPRYTSDPVRYTGSIEEWARRYATLGEWDRWDAPRRTNRGTTEVVFRRWRNADGEEA